MHRIGSLGVAAWVVALAGMTGPAYAGKTTAVQPVTLTKEQVTSAADIEAAINTATGFGSKAGLVVLDGSKGYFLYSAPDRSINIQVSKLTLRGINGATIANCADGVFFDDLAISDVVIEGISFVCSGEGISSVLWASPRKSVQISGNYIQGGHYGIVATNPLQWVISDNTIVGGIESPAFAIEAAVRLTGGSVAPFSATSRRAFRACSWWTSRPTG